MSAAFQVNSFVRLTIDENIPAPPVTTRIHPGWLPKNRAALWRLSTHQPRWLGHAGAPLHIAPDTVAYQGFASAIENAGSPWSITNLGAWINLNVLSPSFSLIESPKAK
jgi:hypothetical protein